MDAQSHLNEIKARIAASERIAAAVVIAEQVSFGRGYFRARLALTNGDFLEVSEYFGVDERSTETLEYRYQWIDQSQEQLIKRWDNARHFPGLPNFPHHVHVGDERNVEPGEAMSIIESIDFIESDLLR